MPTFKTIPRSDIQTSTSVLNQLVDTIEEDISGSSTRKAYQHFITGGIGPGVTSSLYQTVFDQDFSLETANAVADITIGIRSGSATISNASTGEDAGGKILFPSNIVMGREKVNIYKQMAQTLLGNQDYVFDAPFSGLSTESTSGSTIDHAFFISFKRLFTRDGIKRQSFAMQMNASSSHDPAASSIDTPNLNVTSELGGKIYTDIGVSTTLNSTPAGRVGTLASSTDSSYSVGSIFYDQGVVVLDLDKVLSGSEHASGSFDSVLNSNGKSFVGLPSSDGNFETSYTNTAAKFIPDLIMSASIDDFLDHLASCRFSSGSNASFSFQNETQISSTLAFCRVNAGEFNYSSNSTYTDSAGVLRVMESNIESSMPYSFITTIGLYDASDNLLAVAKTSRPVENTHETDLTFRIRLDF
jgi:hypothetical protein